MTAPSTDPDSRPTAEEAPHDAGRFPQRLAQAEAASPTGYLAAYGDVFPPQAPAGDEPATVAAPAAGGLSPRMRGWAFALIGSLATTAVLGTGLVVGYEIGLAKPATEVTVVDGARPEAGFGQDVHAIVSKSVVRISGSGQGSGSGFFVDETTVLTNAHVVVGAATAAAQATDPEVNVLLGDGRVVTGKVRAWDMSLDLAIVKVDKGLGVPALAFHPDRRVAHGSPVAAFGFPFGGDLSMSTGVVSTYVANSPFAESPQQALLLQTDAAINPGNSGGPLVDGSGAVVGVVTLRPDQVGGRDTTGVAFAIPSVVASSAVTQLTGPGEVSSAVLGVQLGPVKEPGGGIPVVEVTDGSGAGNAGVRAGDEITHVNAVRVRTPVDVVAELAGRKAGDTVTLDVSSEKEGKRQVTVKLGER